MADDHQSNRNCEHCGGTGYIDSYPEFAFGARFECTHCLEAGRITVQLLYKEAVDRRLINKIDPYYCIESHFIGHLKILCNK